VRAYDIIEKKRDGYELSGEEIDFMVEGYTGGVIPDYQMSAWLMAVYFQGMTDRETADLTMAMMNSGSVADMSRFGKFVVDKHSSGGVGDKTTLIIAPVIASLGCKIPKMSGRGLGHTGGTLDKLESIPGFKTALTVEEFENTVNDCGMVVASQTEDITPADKKIYALRDTTATVSSIPLIASSIMSKKLASGAPNIVLDVTIGSGAFMKSVEEGKLLAEKMVAIGKSCGRNVSAVLTNMDEPLGFAVGNAIEVEESVRLLRGEKIPGLYEVCVSLAANMLALASGGEYGDCVNRVLQAIETGAAFEQFKKWIRCQGGDTRFTDNFSLLPSARYEKPVTAVCSGYITRMDAELVGKASCMLGAGRLRYDDEIDHAAGIVLRKKVGDMCSCGDTVCILKTSDPSLFEEAERTFNAALSFGEEKPPVSGHMVLDIVR
jgi:pyrimidine-nucleoside phosphorylase